MPRIHITFAASDQDDRGWAVAFRKDCSLILQNISRSSRESRNSSHLHHETPICANMSRTLECVPVHGQQVEVRRRLA
jgi:hypothetical protein